MAGGAGAAALLERGRSEVSSIVSEVPDYLFGFDNNSEETPPAAAAARQTNLAMENRSLYEPGSNNVNRNNVEIPVEPQVHRQTSYIPNPAWQFVAEPMPVYYVPGPMMPGGSLPVQPLPMPFPIQAHGLAPVGYPQPVQGVVGNPIQGSPVYYAGTQMIGAAYEYPVAGEGQVPESVTSGGLMINPTFLPFYQTIQPAELPGGTSQ
ncbi:uncharacterized protein LOC110032268 [Phalaenopsis equestris]|uniref:uncharacterized protein LOC110032268 n=1 Tax=Phalaenopsis equestris TaxID=78828 RepID=UPI0009E1E295|nr:uncharacterized protein LOC110032268 [Phalaenopsis equestris]